MQANKSRRASEPPHRMSTGGSHQQRRISSYTSQKEHPMLERVKDLNEELKRTRDQLASSETSLKSAQQEAEEAGMKLLMMSSKYEDSRRQLIELSTEEDDRIHSLCRISQARDKAWQLELAALRNQQSIDMAVWSSVTREAQELKSKIELLKEELIEKDSVIEGLKIQVESSGGVKESSQTEQDRSFENKGAEAEIADLKSKLSNKDADLRSLLDMNKKLNDEIVRAQVSQVEADFGSKIVHETVDISELTIESSHTESELESELKEAKAVIAESKSKLENMDADLKSILDMNMKLNNEIKAHVNQVKAEFSSKITEMAVDVSEMKAKLADKDAALGPIEAELRKARVQSNQWRKAAETAAALLMEWNDAAIIGGRTRSVDPECLCDATSSMNSPSSDELGGESPGSRNRNVLGRIAGLWKKR